MSNTVKPFDATAERACVGAEDLYRSSAPRLCETCRWWCEDAKLFNLPDKPERKVRQGLCRRFPPIEWGGGITCHDDWCGEHSASARLNGMTGAQA